MFASPNSDLRLTSIPLIFFSLASGFCDLDNTTINNGSEIYTWNETPAGTNQSQECIHGGGMAIRLCRFASGWEKPDLSSCISRITSDIQVIVDVSCSPAVRDRVSRKEYKFKSI